MQSTNQPAKFLVPFAQNDSAKVEIPATSSDPTRFSQSLGSPPLTGMPPEAGGVPPQLEDFNGAMNQLARGVWWALGGGRFAYDASWATDPLINGYARGAVLPAALGAGTVGMGEWYNNTEANTADPDVLGTGWVPGYHYGTTALTGQTGGTVTLTPAQAAKRVITVAGTLTSNLVLVVPGWVYTWTVVNNTGGAYSVTVKNAATAAVEIPQNGAPTPISCDGTAVTLWSPNIPAAVFDTQPVQFGQATGRLIAVRRFTTVGTSVYTPTPGTRSVVVEVVGGGGAGGGTAAAISGQGAAAGGGGAGAQAKARITAGFSGVTVTVAAGGAGTFGGNGNPGGSSSFGTLVVAPGGNGAPQGGSSASGSYSIPGIGSGSPTFSGADTTAIVGTAGPAGLNGTVYNSTSVFSGMGGSTPYGNAGHGIGAVGTGQSGTGNTGAQGGAGGSGGVSTSTGGPGTGGGGGAGLVIVWEYA